jgi:hypothetical protein
MKIDNIDIQATIEKAQSIIRDDKLINDNFIFPLATIKNPFFHLR